MRFLRGRPILLKRPVPASPPLELCLCTPSALTSIALMTSCRNHGFLPPIPVTFADSCAVRREFRAVPNCLPSRFDQHPAYHTRSVFDDMTVPPHQPRRVFRRRHPEVAGETLAIGEAFDVVRERHDRLGRPRPDTRNRTQQRQYSRITAATVGPLRTEPPRSSKTAGSGNRRPLASHAATMRWYSSRLSGVPYSPSQ